MTTAEHERRDQGLEEFLRGAGLPVAVGGVHVGDDLSTFTFRAEAGLRLSDLDLLSLLFHTKAIDFGSGDGGSVHAGVAGLQVVVRQAKGLGALLDEDEVAA